MSNIRVSSLAGELRTNREMMARLNEAVIHHDFSLIVVFPTQSLLRHIQEKFLNTPETGGIGGIRFLLFEGFVNEITEELGISPRRPSPLVRELFIARGFAELVEAGELNYLNQVPFNTAYRQAVLGGISEWKRSGLTVEIFREWAAEKGAKERELTLLYQKYQGLLAEYGYDEEDGILGELEDLYREARLNPARRGNVILYGFTDLTPLQSDFIKVLSLWFDFEAIVDPTDIAEFREFTARCFPAPSVTGPVENANPEIGNALDTLQRRFWTEKPDPAEIAGNDCSVQLLLAGGIYRQASGIARYIKQWFLENASSSLADILVISPQPQEFIQAARPVFQDYGLCLEETVQTVREFPSVHLFTRSLAAAVEDWPWTDMESLIRMVYFGQNTEIADKLIFLIGECYGALSGKKRWLALLDDPVFQERIAEKDGDIEPLRAGLTRLALIPQEASLETYLSRAAEWFDNPPDHFGSDPALFRCYIDDCRAVQLVQQTIREISDYCRTIIRLPEKIGLEEFQVFFEEYLLPLELKPLPQPVQGIRVIQLREARGLNAQLAFITGLEQGVCPRVYINDWKLGAKARWKLKSLGIELETGVQYNLEERISFYWAMQTAAERLILVSRDQDESGQPLNRSAFLDDILEWFPGLVRNAVRYSLAPSLPGAFTECFSGKEQRNRLAATMAGDGSTLSQSEMALCYILARYPQNFRLIRHLSERFSERPGRTPVLEKPVSIRLLQRRYGPDTVFPVTVLEDYQTCPLRFYFKNFLKVRVLPRPELRPEGPDLGILYHRILHDFAAIYRDQSLDPEKRAEYQERLHSVYQKAFQEWRQNSANDLVSFVLEILGKQIEDVLDRWLDTELQWSLQTGERFRFSGLELAFGLEKGDFDAHSVPRPFRIESQGEEILLAGKIDRVDADSEGRFIVYDYKLGKGPGSKDLFEGKRLQIPLYIMALEQLKYGDAKGVGGSYLGLAHPSRLNGGLWRQTCPGLNSNAASVLPDNVWNEWLEAARQTVADIVQSIRAGRFFNLSNDCLSYCEYRTACRRQEWEVEQADEITGT